ncbi:MAG: ABC transporter ATP-binding protein [Gemmatimonadetes bacterium]|nr:ABC transporter ATP-binding protein [Gemmatimonadota bacterium]
MPPTPPDSSEEDVLGKAYDARLARRLLRYAWPYRALIASSLALLVIDGALQLVGPLLTRRVIDVAIPAGDATAILHAALLFGGTLLAQFGCTYGETVLTARLGQRVMHDLRTQLFAHLQRLPVAYFDRNPVGRLVTRVTSDVESLNELFTSGVVAGLGDVFTLLAISILMLVVDWRLALAAFAVIPLVVIASNVFRVRVREAYRAIRTRLARINAFLQERLSGVRVVQLFGREGDEARRFDALNKDHLDAHLTSITIYALYFPIIELLTTIAIAAILVAGAARVDLATLSVGTVAAFLQLVRRFFEPLQDLSDKYNTLQQAMAASERIFALLDEESDVRRATGDASAGALGASATGRALPAQSTDSPRASTTPGDGGAQSDPRLRSPVSIEFRHVWFAYAAPHAAAGDTADRPPEWVLRDVNFVARPGRTLAIVGHTGAGKTTIINLLLGFYQPQRGEILINGIDQRELPVADVRRLIGYVQQDIFLFAGDIASNIRLSTPLTDAQVRDAATRVGADRLVQRLPGGYGYALGERGSSVSVGERQLLSFARAIAADPAVLVLDEATSAVDSEIEGEIQRALAELMRGRTTIAIAHRLSTIRDADEILVMHHGEVRERGTHRELQEMGGLYERLTRLQTGVVRGA